MKGNVWKKMTALMLALALAAGWGPAARAEGGGERFAMPRLEVPCKAAVLMEQTGGTVLFEKEPDTPLPMASITKVMTLLLTFEALEAGKVGLEDIVPVTEHAYSMGGSQIWLEPGEEMTLNEMLKAICVSSANDAAVAVAEYVGGSEGAFVEMMNRRAEELGLTNTHFANACGLDAPGHHSSARDIALLSREILEKHPRVLEYTTIWMDSLRGGATQLINTNKMLKKYQGITGLKTGTTGGAGICITASAQREGLKLIAVVLGSPSSEARFDSAAMMLDYGFANFEAAAPAEPPQVPPSLPVEQGESETAELAYTLPEHFLLAKGEGGSLKCQVQLPQSLKAPAEKGQQVGKIQVYAGDTLLDEYPVITANSVKKREFSMALGWLWQAVRAA
ncbi:MAG: D-alanyl-D-alanine carboxypeptidase [Oscillospiraceae bacterium]|nr:D-alanyl-D-alanine carboxypeptidase [Oscillospiraceae bacterium]